MGVNQEELNEIIDYYKLGDYIKRDELLTTMQELYNGYKFNEEVEETLYNTGMIMYIVSKINSRKKYPLEMLDDNIKTDYGKIRILAQNFDSKNNIKEIIEENKLIGPTRIN